jgi:hypothetical protein
MMSGLIRKATLLSVCGLFGATVAFAGVPNAGQSKVSRGINLVGQTGVTPDSRGLTKIIVKDASGNLVANSTVTVDFSAGSDLHICSVQPFAGMAVSCGTRTVIAVTNASGEADFTVVGHSVNVGGGSPGSPAAGYGGGVDTASVNQPGAAVVKADGVTIGRMTVGTFDENGVLGANAVDVGLWLNDKQAINLAPAKVRDRSDYNWNHVVDGVDLALLLQARFSGQDALSCSAAVCP